MFYVYEFGDIVARFRWEYDRFFYDRWCREACKTLVAHPERTDDPSHADFFVISATLRCVSFAAFDLHSLDKHISELPFLGGGTPHVVFDLTDNPRPIFRDSRLLVCKSALHEQFYEPRLHVSFPQFPRYRFDRPIVQASKRRHLAGFKGNPRPQYGNLRQRLLSLHDGDRLIVQGGVFMPEDNCITQSGDVREVVRPGEWSYENMLHNSTFALLPRACGYALSYRMIESMNAGCIPVIISDGYVLPFSEELNYNEFSVRIPETDVENLREILEGYLPVADSLQRRAREVYESHFSTTDQIIDRAMRIVGQQLPK